MTTRREFAFGFVASALVSSQARAQGGTMNLATDASSWKIMYDGYGSVTFGRDIMLRPNAASSPSVTHAALVLAKETVDRPARDFDVSFTVATERQLRMGTPNAWEVFWLFFNYVPTADGKKRTNYFMVKPNGIELGTASEELQQTFLYTAEAPRLVLGRAAQWRILKVGDLVEAYIDGQRVMSFRGKVYDVPGSIGLYTEDAQVAVRDVRYRPL